MSVSCCYGCTTETGRYPGCHGKCEKYKAERAKLDREKAKRRGENDVKDYLCTSEMDRMDRLTKKRKSYSWSYKK